MDDKTTKLIVSYGTEIINKRFQVKLSVFDNGINPASMMVVVRDLKDNGFTIKMFKHMDDVGKFLNVLKES